MAKFLGLELSGAKNQKTTLSVLEFFPREKKIFLLHLLDGIGPDEDLSGDALLLDCLIPYRGESNVLTVNVPLSFPPCAPCKKNNCSLTERCTQAEVKWMREFTKKVFKQGGTQTPFSTPYTQRPIELWLRHEVIAHLPKRLQFEVDEALGGSRAPLTARMGFLKKSLKNFTLIEALPKLTVARIGQELGLSLRTLESYRSLERGSLAREEILEALIDQEGIFIYDKDFKRLSQNLTAFDSFICAFTGFLADQGRCEKKPKAFPKSSAWIEIPCSS